MGGDGRTASELARAVVSDFREAWFRIGTCTEPADRPRAEAIIARLYA